MSNLGEDASAQQFILTLPSNDPTVTPASVVDYRILFPQNIDFDGRWVVSLLSIERTPTVVNQSLYLYTSVVTNQIIGSEYAPLLCRVPGTTTLTPGQIYRMPQPMEFKEVSLDSIDSLEIDIRDGTGAPAALDAASVTTVELLFKRIN